METVRALATAGADVVLCSRSVEAGQAVADELAAGGGLKGSLTVKQLDLADLHSVRAFADGVAAACPAIDLLVLNAGVMAMPHTLTKQNFEMQWGTNHVGHWYLTSLLLPKLVAQGTPVRVVAVSSMAHAFAKEMPMDDLNWETRKYGSWSSYGQSKICNILFAKELSRRMAAEGAPVAAFSLHPGVIRTNLSRHMGFSGSVMRAVFALPGLKQLFSIKSPEQVGGWVGGGVGGGRARGTASGPPNSWPLHTAGPGSKA